MMGNQGLILNPVGLLGYFRWSFQVCNGIGSEHLYNSNLGPDKMVGSCSNKNCGVEYLQEIVAAFGSVAIYCKLTVDDWLGLQFVAEDGSATSIHCRSLISTKASRMAQQLPAI